MRLCSIQIMRVHILLVLSYIFLSFLEMLLEFLFLSRRREVERVHFFVLVYIIIF